VIPWFHHYKSQQFSEVSVLQIRCIFPLVSVPHKKCATFYLGFSATNALHFLPWFHQYIQLSELQMTYILKTKVILAQHKLYPLLQALFECHIKQKTKPGQTPEFRWTMNLLRSLNKLKRCHPGRNNLWSVS
jgi:hypothetical protein